MEEKIIPCIRKDVGMKSCQELKNLNFNREIVAANQSKDRRLGEGEAFIRELNYNFA